MNLNICFCAKPSSNGFASSMISNDCVHLENYKILKILPFWDFVSTIAELRPKADHLQRWQMKGKSNLFHCFTGTGKIGFLLSIMLCVRILDLWYFGRYSTACKCTFKWHTAWHLQNKSAVWKIFKNLRIIL